MMLFRIYLILNDAKVKPDKKFFDFTPGKKSISFKELQKIISSLNGVEQDLDYCKKYNADKDCYYIYDNNEELIKFEINYGDKNTSPNFSRVSISTKPSVPSKETRKLVAGFVEKILSKIPMQIYFVDEGKIISLDELKKKIYEKDESVEELLRLGRNKK